MPARKTSSRMASPEELSSPSYPEGNSEPDSNAEDRDQSRPAGTAGQSEDILLQAPDSGDRTPAQPVETSTRNWNTPVESARTPPSFLPYHYEPQGELVHEPRDHRILRAEFSIPSAVRGFDTSRGGLNIHTSQSENFTVPRRPTGNAPAVAGVKRRSESEGSVAAARSIAKRTMLESSEEAISPIDVRQPSQGAGSRSGPPTQGRSGTGTAETRQSDPPMDADRTRAPLNSGGATRRSTDSGTPMVLPARKVFPIQIGDKLFRLSGASISSDGQCLPNTSVKCQH